MENDTMMEKNKFIIEEYLPDFEEKNIEINLNKEERTIEIKAKKASCKEESSTEGNGEVEKQTYEEESESFYKKLTIPDEVNIDSMQKTFHKDGTLSIVFDK